MQFQILAVLALARSVLAQEDVAREILITMGENGIAQYKPDSVTANVGDTIKFIGHGDHTVVSGPFGTPCEYNENSYFWSGYLDTANDENQTTVEFKVTTTEPIYFYCAVGKHCQNGMAGGINVPTSGDTLDAYRRAAVNTTTKVPPVRRPFGGHRGSLRVDTDGDNNQNRPDTGSDSGDVIPTTTTIVKTSVAIVPSTVYNSRTVTVRPTSSTTVVVTSTAVENIIIISPSTVSHTVVVPRPRPSTQDVSIVTTTKTSTSTVTSPTTVSHTLIVPQPSPSTHDVYVETSTKIATSTVFSTSTSVETHRLIVPRPSTRDLSSVTSTKMSTTTTTATATSSFFLIPVPVPETPSPVTATETATSSFNVISPTTVSTTTTTVSSSSTPTSGRTVTTTVIVSPSHKVTTVATTTTTMGVMNIIPSPVVLTITTTAGGATVGLRSHGVAAGLLGLAAWIL